MLKSPALHCSLIPSLKVLDRGWKPKYLKRKLMCTQGEHVNKAISTGSDENVTFLLKATSLPLN